MDDTEQVLQDRLEARLRARWVAGVDPHIDCGRGWYDLLNRLDRQLARLRPDYQIVRIRVKDGQLRYQIRLGTLPRQEPGRGQLILQIRRAVSQAEQASSTICELSGEAGELACKDGQIRCLSAGHRSDGWQLLEPER